MGDGIKVKINHHPITYFWISLIINLILMFIAICETDSPCSFMVCMAFIVVSIVITELLSAMNGFLSADNEKLHFRYVRYEEDIFYSDITEISYGTYTEFSGRYRMIRIVLTVKTADGEEHTFNDRIDTKEIAASFDINGRDDVPVIRMYRFLAERLPDRAIGFVKSEEECNL